jgi:histidinol dehydrogenase
MLEEEGANGYYRPMPSSTASPFADHRRESEFGRLLYLVQSRRSGGLSLGVNLFPDRKTCSFDCPYCEIFPFVEDTPFDAGELARELDAFARSAVAARGGPVRDISFSGNGEPTLSPHLGEALAACAAARRGHPEALGGAKLVLITNSTGFLLPAVSSLLASYVQSEGLEIWAKLDSGTEAGFARMSRSSFSLDSVVRGLEAFARDTSLVIQTMVCSFPDVADMGPELLSYASLLGRLALNGARIREVQLYTQARPAPDGITSPLPDGELLAAARLVEARVSALLAKSSVAQPAIRVFGEGGELS